MYMHIIWCFLISKSGNKEASTQKYSTCTTLCIFSLDSNCPTLTYVQIYLHFPVEQHIHIRSNIGHNPISILRHITSTQSAAEAQVQRLNGPDTGHLLDGQNNKPQHEEEGSLGITSYLRRRGCGSAVPPMSLSTQHNTKNTQLLSSDSAGLRW
jgi:hypothetical protein